MRSNYARILTLLLVFVFQISFAQDLKVSGVVTSQTDGMPLPGATVMVEGTSNGVATDLDGKYTINAKSGDKLVVSFIGMTKQVVTVKGSNLNISLADDTSLLGEVVVQTGYTSTVKAKSNIATTTIGAETINNRPNQSFVQTLQGQVAGLNIATGSGEPGAASSIYIRGIGSINGSSDPLFVIDGVQMSSSAFRSLNPNEIESATVLKDAGATAIYGNRGSNGVIVITTKRGGYETPLTFQYSGMTGVAFSQSDDYNLMNSKDYLPLERELGVGIGVGMTDEEIANYAVNTKWKDQFMRTALNQSHTLSMQQGGVNSSSFTSFGFSTTEGIVKGSDLMKFNLRSNVNGKTSNNIFKYATSTNLNYSKRNTIGSVGTAGINQNLLLGSYLGLPYISPSSYVSGQQLVDDFQSFGMAYTPLFLLDKMKKFTNTTDEIKAIFNAKGDLRVAKGLNLSASGSMEYTQNNNMAYQNPDGFNALYFLNNGQEYGGTESNSMSRIFNTNINAKLAYKTEFADKHSFEVAALTEYIKAHYKYQSLTQNGLDPKTSAPGGGTGWIAYDGTVNYLPSISASSYDAGMFSYLAYADYDFDSRYGLYGTVRRDASYRFNNTNRWGTFWSLSGRWNISNEKFMENSGFDELKLRASYGLTGNQQITGTSIFDARNLNRTLYAQGTGYGNQSGYGLSNLGNDDLKWEVSKMSNIGLDFEFWKSRVRGTFEVYNKKTEKLFLGNPISVITGQSEIDSNLGTMVNKGIEAQVAFDVVNNKEAEFKITLNGNISYNHNEITELPLGETTWDGESLNGQWVGEKAFSYYLIPYAGVNPTTGNLLFLDRNNNYTENPDQVLDRRLSDKNFLPVYQGGFGIDIDYKGWYASANFTFVKDIWRMDYNYSGLMDASNLGTFNLSNDILNYWTPDNTVTSVPALNASNINYESYSDRFLTDASYLRLRNVAVGYNFPKRLLNNSAFSSMKVYAQGENLITWSEWRGWDAESSRAADQNNFPTPRSVSVGLELKF